jgi:hypothetical protein
MALPELTEKARRFAGLCRFLRKCEPLRGLLLVSGYLICLRSFVSLNNVKVDFIAFLQTLISIELNGAEVHKYIGPAFPPDESISFCVVKPLHLACVLCHGSPHLLGRRQADLQASYQYRRRIPKMVARGIVIRMSSLCIFLRANNLLFF